MIGPLSSLAFGIVLQFSNPTNYYKVTTFCATLVPMAAGVGLQLALKKRVNDPYLHEFLNRFMNAFNTVLALPAISPLTSWMEHALYNSIQTLFPTSDSSENSTEHKPVHSYLESVWDESHKHYSTHARASRYVIHEALEIVASAMRTAIESKDRAKIIAELAIRLRLFFSEFGANDAHITRTANIYFPQENLEILEAVSLKKEVLEIIRQQDREFEEADVTQYYKTLLDLWLGKDPNIYLVLGLGDLEKERLSVETHLKAGISKVQLDARKLDSVTALELAKTLRTLTQKYSVPFFINTDIDLALQSNADGVHFMKASLVLEGLQRAKQANLQVGLSLSCIEDISNFEPYVDYFSLGPIFYSQTYPHAEPKGLQNLQNVSTRTQKPVYAAGGIRSSHLKEVFDKGAYGVVKRAR